jgi:hypothetical protein
VPGSPFAFGTQPTLIGYRATVIAESQPPHHHDAGGVRDRRAAARPVFAGSLVAPDGVTGSDRRDGDTAHGRSGEAAIQDSLARRAR